MLFLNSQFAFFSPSNWKKTEFRDDPELGTGESENRAVMLIAGGGLHPLDKPNSLETQPQNIGANKSSLKTSRVWEMPHSLSPRSLPPYDTYRASQHTLSLED